MVTFYPTAKAVSDGFIPMVNIRNAKGQRAGCVVPKGEERAWRTFPTALEAEIDARICCLKASQLYAFVKVA